MACLAQFYPLKYPASFWLLASCVSIYAVLSTAMTAVASLLERDGIAFTHPCPKKVGGRAGGGARGRACGLMGLLGKRKEAPVRW